jgi:hypothetical protein
MARLKLHGQPKTTDPLTAAEIQRRNNNTRRLLDLLRDRKPKTTTQCMVAAGLRFGARLLELRAAGFMIDTHVHGDHAEYVLVAEPGDMPVVLDHRRQAVIVFEEAA